MKLSQIKEVCRSAQLANVKSNALVAFTCMATVCSVGTTHADDTEIFTGVIGGAGTSVEQNPDFFPNVLFVLDNSTSMGSTEPVLDRIIDLSDDDDDDDDDDGEDCSVDLNNYDSDFDYSFGNDSSDSDIYIYGSNGSFANKVVTTQQNQCKAYNDQVVNGSNTYIQSQLIQWGRSPNNNSQYSWDNSIARMDDSASSGTECRADLGVHGHFTRNTGDTNPRNRDRNRFDSDIGEHYFRTTPGSNPYNGAESVFWVSGNYHRYIRLRSGADDLPANCQGGGSGDADDPFDSSQPVGTINNPNEADSIDDMCGGPDFEDRDATTGRSRLNFTNGTTVYYKNRYYKLKDSDNDNLIRVYRCQTRLEIMKEALTRVLTDETSINAGLMRFNANNSSSGTNGGTVISAIAAMNDEDNNKKIIEEIQKLEFGNATPLAESLYEAYRYFSGSTIDQGRKTAGSWDKDHATFDVDFRNFDTRDRTDFQTDPRARSGNNYVSPIATQCQANSIVLLSDGEPTNDNDRDDEIGQLTGGNCSKCSDDIAGYLKNADVASSNLINAGVNTFTIGLNLDSTTLENIADRGAPDGVEGYFTASDTDGLELAFRSILGQIEATEADVFSAPAVTVNAFNRLQNREDIYYALFKPENSARWGGNVKKYRVDGENAQIVDANGDNAIDTAEGFFKETTQSFWSVDIDGNVVSEGGAGEQLKFARRLFGNIDGNDVSLSSATLADAAQAFVTATSTVDIGASISGGDSLDENKLKIAAWTLGLDIEGDREGTDPFRPNQYVGDSLHGTPYVLSFGDSDTNPEDVIFYTSNQGLLHAIDGDTGSELWSYVVDEDLYSNLGAYYNNQTADKLYGLDGEIAFKITRDPSTTTEIDEALLFFGQRRGGSSIFAVDVTDARRGGTAAPMDRKWVIDGGPGGTSGFERMGQTWAEPVVTEVNICSNDNGCPEGNFRSVLFISGGYDPYYDDQALSVASASGNVLGNAVYMVDANSGQLLWMVGADVEDTSRDLEIPEMKHSIVSKPTVLDTDANGTADTIFFTDIAGQVFRVDFKTSRFDSDDISDGSNEGSKVVDFEGQQRTIDSVSGGMIADLSEGGADRRFYNPLDITILPEERDDVGNQIATARYAITTGSGYRAHPLAAETFGNRIYVLYDENILAPKPSGTGTDELEPSYEYVDGFAGGEAIEPGDLASRDINIGGTSSSGGALSSQARSFSLSADIPLGGFGYYINMPLGSEKLLNPSVISDFRLLAVSYVPSDNNAANLADKCEAGLGRSIVYSFDLLTGDGQEITLNNPGISPSPVVVYVLVEDGNGQESISPVVIIGTEPLKGEDVGLSDLDIGKAKKTSWWESGRIK